MFVFKGKSRRLKSKIDKFNNNPEELIHFLKEGYCNDAFEFHRLFLHSRTIYSVGPKILLQVAEELDNKDIDKNIYTMIKEDLICLSELLEKYINYEQNLILIFKDYNIQMEDLFYYLEYIKHKMLTEGLSLDGKTYPLEILSSQYNHIIDSFPGILEMIKNLDIKTNHKEPKIKKTACKEIFEIVGFKENIRGTINAICMEIYKPKHLTLDNEKFKSVYYLERSLPYWGTFEEVRDLNYNYFIDYSLEMSESIKLWEKIGFLKMNKDQSFMKSDFSKEHDVKATETVKKAYRFLAPIYSSPQTAFLYENNEYTIEELLTFYEKIYCSALLMKSNKDNNFIRMFGEKRLILFLQLNQKQKELLKLLTYDLEIDNLNMANYKPLIKIGKIYFILPSWILSRSIEGVIDKILSNVQVNFGSLEQKGFSFEENINQLFRENNIPFSNVKPNQKKGIPEIDGIFTLDNYVFLFDAKATIKPDSILNAYYFLRDTLIKAEEQLELRIQTLTQDDSTKRKLIEQETGLQIEGKTLAPFILTSHNFFSGYKELSNNQNRGHLPLIDFASFKRIIEKKTVPVWEFNNKRGCYTKTEKNCNTAKDIYDYMLNQIDYFKSIREPQYQILENGLMFEISRPVKICNS